MCPGSTSEGGQMTQIQVEVQIEPGFGPNFEILGMVRELPHARIASESIINGSYMHNYPKYKFPDSCVSFLEEISSGELEMCSGSTSKLVRSGSGPVEIQSESGV